MSRIRFATSIRILQYLYYPNVYAKAIKKLKNRKRSLNISIILFVNRWNLANTSTHAMCRCARYMYNIMYRVSGGDAVVPRTYLLYIYTVLCTMMTRAPICRGDIGVRTINLYSLVRQYLHL